MAELVNTHKVTKFFEDNVYKVLGHINNDDTLTP